MNVNFSNAELQSRAVDLGKIALQATETIQKLASNIGNIGITPDFSGATLRSPLQNDFPLLNWLMNTSASVQMREMSRKSLSFGYRGEDGGYYILLPTTIYTTPPEDTSGACCWVPFDIGKCNGRVPLSMLCLQDCNDIFDNFINMARYPGGNDLTSYFQNPGESVKDARKRMARLSMAFFTAYNVINGTMDSSTDVLKPFHGLLEVLENPAVLHVEGTNVLGAFETLACRLAALDGGNYAIAVNQMTYRGISSIIKPGRNGQLPEGWTKNGDTISFMGINFIQDKTVPVDFDNGTGEAWVIDGETTGLFLGTGLYPTDAFIRESFAHNNDPAQGCAVECTYYYNYGTVFNTNSNRLLVIQNIPLATNCTGSALQGLEGLYNPNTLVPLV